MHFTFFSQSSLNTVSSTLYFISSFEVCILLVLISLFPVIRFDLRITRIPAANSNFLWFP